MKYIIICISVLFLQSCFSFSETQESGSGMTTLVEQKTDVFSISTPNTWKKISLSDIPVPKSGEIVFAIASTEPRQGYLNNIVILKAPNTLKESSQGLIKNSGPMLDMNLQSYAVKKEEVFIFADGEQSLLLTFLGKYNSQTPEVTYLQTARACGEDSYFLTLSLAEQLESYERYADLLRTFSCKK